MKNFNDIKVLDKKALENIKGGRALKPGEQCPTGMVLCPDGVFCRNDISQCYC